MTSARPRIREKGYTLGPRPHYAGEKVHIQEFIDTVEPCRAATLTIRPPHDYGYFIPPRKNPSQSFLRTPLIPPYFKFLRFTA